MSRFLVIELHSAGHRPRYLRWVVESRLSRNAEMILAGPRSLLEHHELSTLRGRFVSEEVEVEDAAGSTLRQSSFSAIVKKQLVFRSLHRRAYEKAKRHGPIDLAVVPSLDLILDAWALLGSPFERTPWIGISMKASFHYGSVPGMLTPRRRDAWLRRQLFRRLLRDSALQRILTIDPTMMEFAASLPVGERTRLAYLPDPSVEYELPPRLPTREQLGIPSDAIVILAYGALSGRKGIRELLQAANHSDCPRSVHILLAGRQYEDVRDILKGDDAQSLHKGGRLHVIEGYIDERLEPLVLAAADAMWLGYLRFYHMSGVLVLAVFHGLPILFTRDGVIGHLGRKFRIGAEIDVESMPSILGSLRLLANDPARFRLPVAEAKVRLGEHSIAHFQKVVSEAAGMPLAARNN